MFKILILLFSVSVLAQVPTEKAIMDEAKRRNIDTVEKVLDELSKNGISENQAKELARQQGISFDDFLKNNFTAKSSMSNAVAFDPDTTILLSNKDSISNTDEFFIKEPLDLIKPDTSFFGYSIFDKNQTFSFILSAIHGYSKSKQNLCMCDQD